ncbi:MAG: hypothetical protein ABI333_06055 [bacterium]
MRITALVIATIMLLLTAGVGLLGTNRSLKDATDIDKIVKPVKAQINALAAAGNADAKRLKDLAGKTGRLRGGAVLFGLTALLAIGLIVMMFLNKYVIYTAGGLAILAILSILVNPSYDMGPTAPASARSLAIFVGVVAALGAGAAYGASALKARKLAKQQHLAHATA